MQIFKTVRNRTFSVRFRTIFTKSNFKSSKRGGIRDVRFTFFCNSKRNTFQKRNTFICAKNQKNKKT